MWEKEVDGGAAGGRRVRGVGGLGGLRGLGDEWDR